MDGADRFMFWMLVVLALIMAVATAIALLSG